MENFLIRAIFAGLGIALMAAPFGCFVVWRRLSYFGDTMAHSALLGVALALLADMHPVPGIFIIVLAIAFGVEILQKRMRLSGDSMLGIFSHSTLAFGIIAVSLVRGVRIDLLGYLFGDVLTVTTMDVYLIYGGLAVVYVVFYFIWRPLLVDTVSPEIAQAEKLYPNISRYVYTLLLAILIAFSIKVVGIVMITSLLIIPAATATRFAKSPESTLVFAIFLGGVAIMAGFWASFRWDTPSGPSIVASAAIMFLLAALLHSPKK